MISIQDAEQIIAARVPKPQMQQIPLEESLGYYLAENIAATEPLPHFDNSAMDGFAVALPAAEFDVPLDLPVVGESQAGEPFGVALEKGTSIRISTGAMVPPGTDVVVPVEDTEIDDEYVKLKEIGPAGNHIRRKGEEIQSGEVLAVQGTQVTPPLLAWIGTFGITEINVYKKPRIAILTTGQELMDFSEPLQPGQIRNSNQLYLQSLMNMLDLPVTLSVRVPDSLEETMANIRAAGEVADIIVLSGGVSVGPHDHVKEAAEGLGFERHLWKVAQKPGKPLYFASGESTLLFGMPGNPVSTLVSTLHYLYPTVQKIAGNPAPGLRKFYCHFNKKVSGLKMGRARFLLVKIISQEQKSGEIIVEPVSKQHSHMLSGVTGSDGYVTIPANTEQVDQNQELMIQLHPWTKI
jgi:molybdopterin molybdotransferase